jgi:hypothetical protein
LPSRRSISKEDIEAAGRAAGARDAVDLAEDLTGHRNFDGRAFGDEADLQIDDDMRDLTHVERFENLLFAVAHASFASDDVFGNRDLVHR